MSEERGTDHTHGSPPTSSSLYQSVDFPSENCLQNLCSLTEHRIDHHDFEAGTYAPPSSPTFSKATTVAETERRPGKRWTSSSSTSTSVPAKESLRNSFLQSIRSIRWQGFLAMIGGIFSQMLCWGLIMAYGTILAFYVRYLIPDVSETFVALSGAIPPFCLLAFALPWGRLLDAGHHRLLNITAGISLTGGIIGLSFTGSDNYNSGKPWAILLTSIPMGVGQSIYFLAAPQMAKTWHPNNKGLAMGITNCGAAIGGVCWPLIWDRLIENHGFRIGVGTLAGIQSAVSIFIAIFAMPAPEFQPRRIGRGNASSFRTWWPSHAFKSKLFTTHVVSMCFIYLGILTIPFFIEIWARRAGHISVSEDIRTGTGVNLERSKRLGVYLLITLNGCQLPGRLFGSTLCDLFCARKIHAIACFAACIIVGTCWFSVSSFAGGMVFAALFGLTLGVMVSLPINDVQDLLGSGRTHLLGQFAGVVYTCASPFILGGAVVSGELVRRFNVFVAPGVWCVVCFFLGGCVIVWGLCIEDDTACFEVVDSGEREMSESGGVGSVGGCGPVVREARALAAGERRGSV